jgi:D-serine deaminase-like pyridoxal phosphate-dependent protein
MKVPSLLIDKAKSVANIERMLQKAQDSGCVLRPHFKTHQSHETARWFRELGIRKIAVSSVSMAQYFAADGWKDIMIAFPVNLREMEEINELAGKVRAGILISSKGVTSMLRNKLKNPVDLYLKVDVGTHRTGFDPQEITSIEKELEDAGKNEMLTFRGFIAHAGHTYQTGSKDEVKAIYEQGSQILKQLRNHFSSCFPGIIISWGDTPSCSIIDDFSGIDELRPGNFVYYDLMQWQLGACKLEEIAIAVAAPVVAVHPGRQEAVVYCGAVHLSKEYLVTSSGEKIFGMVVFVDEHKKWSFPPSMLWVDRLSQEHGILRGPVEIIRELKAGQLLGVLPVHSCLAVHALRD